MDDFTISTSKGRLTESEALEIELDMIPALQMPQKIATFKHNDLYLRKPLIEDLISRHLGIPTSGFVLDEPQDWIHGSFNLCLVLDIDSSHRARLPRTAVTRIPLSIGDFEHSDSDLVDEKLRCEAATYVWLQKNCPSSPTPRLLGIGFPGGRSVRRGLAWMRGEILSPYYAYQRNGLTDIGYLLLEWVDNGKMLSSSWKEYRHDKRRRSNLYRGMTKMMLDIARVPLPRIGSWTMSNNGTISLTNRPLSDWTGFWNKNNVPTCIPRGMTYGSTESFVQDVIRYQDSRMRHQPNAILDKLSSLVALRALVPHFFDQTSRHGPFVLSLVDMHQANIFVDDDWNIVCLIDLEFAPVGPIQMTRVPNWLTDRAIDHMKSSKLDEFKAQYDEFVSTLENEEALQGQDSSYSQRLREDWQTDKFWYLIALASINAFPAIFRDHLYPRFFKGRIDANSNVGALAQLWDEDVDGFIAGKLQDYERYKREIGDIFAAARARALEIKEASAVRDGERPS
ncbi:hypothetical protein E4T47_03812 [Aureobasidium subglaciale]|nr:hypothetical protein E4T47_03812 [Aureobasidium subglaciale]